MRNPIEPHELLPKGLRIEGLGIEPGRVSISVSSGTEGRGCSLCGRDSSRAHSRYSRMVSDLPWHFPAFGGPSWELLYRATVETLVGRRSEVGLVPHGRLHDLTSSPASDGVPARQRATEASLRQRLQPLRAENQRLRDENASLKQELATVCGHQRASAT